MPKVTYKPRENGDPIETVMKGLRNIGEEVEIPFRAGEPVEVPAEIYIMQMIRVETINAEGLPRGIAKEKKVPLIDILAANPYFIVEGKNNERMGDVMAPDKKRGRPAVPKTPQEYRAHAQAWFNTAKTHTELEKRWNDEAALRAKIGIPPDGEDESFLSPFYQAKHHQLKTQQAA